MAIGANGGLCAFEELLAMAPHAGIVTRIISDVGKVSYLFPVFGWNFMAGIAGSLMLTGRVGEARIINSNVRNWWLRDSLPRVSVTGLDTQAGCAHRAGTLTSGSLASAVNALSSRS